MLRRLASIATLVACSLPASALAATYEVGPGKPYASIQDTLSKLGPGDVVEVQGDHTYPGDLWIQTAGSASAPITFRGVSVNGHRPIIAGVGTAQYHNMIVLFYANHLVFENFEIVGDENPSNFGLVNKADDVTLRDLLVHGVANQGLLGTDQGSGSLTLERSEFYGNGSGEEMHQIYMATDETMFPGSVFRMQYCYVHDGVGGNNVKSRAERNEIYSNWIEGAVYHELDLIGPDGQDPSLAREDSDVVGNVLVKHSMWRIARIGGDGTGDTNGRYRFVANTMVLGPMADTAITLQDAVASVEMHDNVVVRLGAMGGQLYDVVDMAGAPAAFFGSHNWIQNGIGNVPASFTGTIQGADPGFTDASTFDLRPTKGSPLVDAGTTMTSIATPPFVNPLVVPTMVPPSRALGTEAPRPM
ncbi:MAG TPA: hypothetical protein VHB21_07720, partial [Minicystis sp.]|nr:hypothetical protein [Minicystis sp.]